jgi:hypothetical protein
MVTQLRSGVVAICLSAAGVTLAAQQASTPAGKAPSAPRVVTLTGCVEKGATPNQYTLQDPMNGRYEVSGTDIKKYLGRRVQVAGTPGSTRFRVKGGLWPTPNVAAQAGSMDPAKAAVAAMPGGPYSGTGDIALPTFKVKAVRTVDGACE